MPYDGYASPADYVARRLKAAGLNAKQLSARVGKSHNYIHFIANGERKPSAPMCASIAHELGDDPQTLRILCGYETPPAEPAAVDLARRIMALPAADRAALERIAEALTKKPK